MIPSPLHNLHTKLGARMVEFAGWNMPLMYRGILEEHHYTRTAASFFDVSHMGRLKFTGRDVESRLQRICTRNLAGMEVGQSRYSHVCREDGGILDDVIVSRCEKHWAMVCNASNRDKILNWLRRQTAGADFDLTDQTIATAMIAVQGPQAVPECARLLPFDVKSIKRYRFITGSYLTFEYTIYRSGYTGEDGLELVLPAKAMPFLMPYVAGNGSDGDNAKSIIKPAGLGARDTLRIEAAMPLYGHELTEDWDSLTAGQGWCVDLEKDFIGVEAMRTLKAQGLPRVLVGLELDGRRTARQGYDVYAGDDVVGKVTSGCLSPTLERSLAMALVTSRHGEIGHELTVDFNGKRNPCKVVKLPFYARPK